MRLGLNLLALLVLLCATVAAQAAGKVALVIGNGAYLNANVLPNPTNDAADVTVKLKELGFEVFGGNDLTFVDMGTKIGEFEDAARDADVTLLFYAGHGMQVNGRNYLVPVDAKLERESSLRFQTIDAEDVLRAMSGPGKTAIALLDACRDNPLSRRFSRSLGTNRSNAVQQGLAVPTIVGGGMLIGFATAPGDVAADGDGRNSPFTVALLKHISTPGLEIQQLMTRVKREVYNSTKESQEPWHNSSLRDEIYLGGEVKQPEPPPLKVQTDNTNVSAEWNLVKDTSSIAVLEAFMAAYADKPLFLALAGERRDALENAQAKAAEARQVTEAKQDAEVKTTAVNKAVADAEAISAEHKAKLEAIKARIKDSQVAEARQVAAAKSAAEMKALADAEALSAEHRAKLEAMKAKVKASQAVAPPPEPPANTQLALNDTPAETPPEAGNVAFDEFLIAAVAANNGVILQAYLLGNQLVLLPPASNPANKTRTMAAKRIASAATMEELIQSNPNLVFQSSAEMSCRIDFINGCKMLPQGLKDKIAERFRNIGIDISGQQASSSYFFAHPLSGHASGSDRYIISNSPHLKGDNDPVAVVAAVVDANLVVEKSFYIPLSKNNQGVQADPKFGNISITWAAMEGDDIIISLDSGSRCDDKPRLMGLLVRASLTDMKLKWVSPYNVSNNNFVITDQHIYSADGGSCQDDHVYQLDKDTGKIVSRLKVKTSADEIWLDGKTMVLRLYEGAEAWQLK